MKRTITIFGSSLPLPGEREYEDACRLGALLAKMGFSICTGGNLGIMEAASKGAFENGAEVTGVVFGHFSAKPNAYLTNLIESKTLFERIERLVLCADGFVVLQGGTGTLLELAVIWEFINKNLMPRKPVACHSSLWREIVGAMELQILKEHRKTGLVSYFAEVEEIANFMYQELNEVC